MYLIYYKNHNLKLIVNFVSNINKSITVNLNEDKIN